MGMTAHFRHALRQCQRALEIMLFFPGLKHPGEKGFLRQDSQDGQDEQV
jgi:hypothetical protein